MQGAHNSLVILEKHLLDLLVIPACPGDLELTLKWLTDPAYPQDFGLILQWHSRTT